MNATGLIIGPGVVEWVAKRTNEFGNFGAAQGVGWQRNGGIIAGVAYGEWNGVNIVAHIASDGTRRWLTREFLRVMFDYPFRQLRAKRITACTGEGNTAAQRFLLHLGFKVETTLEKAHPTGDILVFRMFRVECKWISADISPLYAKAA